MTADATLTIGQLAQRAGVSVAAIRHYEARGLLTSRRTAGGHRLFPRHALRRLAVIAAGQRVGLSLHQVADALSDLPADTAPTQAEWTVMSARWSVLVRERIRELEALERDLDGCIGCGCLSLTRCALFNPADVAAVEGTGSRWLRAAGAARNQREVLGREGDDQ
ncbi:MerR family transcriptional regulator, redox-sensitive transcriptional activator SoxR [Quadrisphaera granulorum]|uniref:MerR family redox-sensitive transcriptional activator SoxR n=1 Tax=Quadrisphaera granulorum TaxID=317664 RepID=A0A316AER5_9ACTN|nr:redox-sensitive transcriptional activator SoxR [Quadrisphaera granulorum]PWJ56223.1 MerR family redox-sensitive transcriptional activator SoxR [Quadrisphaera granulorum]SZE94857.1 MerR family transcriptional regulator, redox-sensitive transcriptional activator SoxR [Quadrisphaera granulorum]